MGCKILESLEGRSQVELRDDEAVVGPGRGHAVGLQAPWSHLSPSERASLKEKSFYNMKYPPPFLLPSLCRFDLTVIWGGSIFLVLKFLPNDKLPGQGISAQWDWCSCHFYCYLQHKQTEMPISLSSCWRLPPNGTLGAPTSGLVHSFQHLQPGAGMPAVRGWPISEDCPGLRGRCFDWKISGFTVWYCD